MGVGVSIFTITLGLILKFAIQPDAMTDPIDVHVVGVILIIVGGVSFALTLLMQISQPNRPSGPNRLRSRSRDEGGRLSDQDNPPRT